MKNLIALIALIVLVAGPLGAQGHQEGSVAIADSIRPASGGVTLAGFTACVADLITAGVAPKDATKECRELSKIVSDTSKKIANEAADATKASRPIVIYGGYGGYGYRRYYGGSSYYRSRHYAAARPEGRNAPAQAGVESRAVRTARVPSPETTHAGTARSIGRSLAQTTRAMAPSAHRR